MKTIIIAVLLFAGATYASPNNQVQMDRPSSYVSAEESVLSFEGGIINSAVNESSSFISLGFVGDLGRWFSLGVRGNIPVYNSLKNPAKMYSVQGLARFNFINDVNNVFFETFLSINSGKKYNVRNGSFGGSLGYLRDFSNNYMAGLNIGTHYAELDHVTLEGEISLILKRLF